MRPFLAFVAVVAIAEAVGGCSGDPGEAPPAAVVVPAATDAGAPVVEVPSVPTFTETTLSRAREWIAAEMPYCGGPNGGKDVICGGTCKRPGNAEKAEWDGYRSDCSGLVSWAWGFPAPGLTTSELAPFETKDSAVIEVGDLEPGDALNMDGHVMLWAGWVDEKAGTASVIQETHCGTTASEKVVTFTHPVDTTTLKISDGRVFHAIRSKGAVRGR